MSSLVRNTAWATAPVASSTAMSSVSFGTRSSSQGCWLPSIYTNILSKASESVPANWPA